MSYYEGQVYQGFRHGNGFFVGPPAEPDLPRIYMSGTWNLGKLVGKGNLKQGSQLYEGTFENSVRTGKGIRYYDPNSVYAGDFINGIRDGNGTMVWENNDVYIGNWKNGLRHGYGEYIWEAYLYPEICFFNQNFYYGTLTLNNGCLYDGSWHDDIKHGTGLIVCKNGLIIKSEQLYYKNRPAMIKGSKNVNEDISENDNRSKKKVITKCKYI
ncbi:radial spoke head 10 homolog B-like [Ctenocephalides felis]|uniref:radial spoke head 10 homolog B-like n=1 Tax=Ctenocephalides felis TaxID=7515 RepID=UPI000E6E2D21|nr:radial spoke head 10 homolog B-like [Ctenocephalides felis]